MEITECPLGTMTNNQFDIETSLHNNDLIGHDDDEDDNRSRDRCGKGSRLYYYDITKNGTNR